MGTLRRRLRCAIVCLLVTFAGTAIPAAAEEAYPYGVSLSDEASDPYRSGERPPSRFTADTKRAIRDYSNIRDCLVWNERNKPRPDLRRFDWDRMRNESDAQVCIFRLAVSLQSVEAVGVWFKNQGFNVTISPKPFERSVTILSAGWSVKKYGTKVPSSGFFHLISRFYIYGQSVTIHWDDSRTPYIVDMSVNVE